MLMLVAIFGGATAFFGPAFDAVVPDVLPESLLPQANSLDQFVRPLALRLAGPAVGGFLIEGVGVGWAFALNATTFAVSAAALLAMARARRRPSRGRRSVGGDIRAASPTSASTCGCGGRSRAPRSPTSVHGAGRGAAAVRGQERAARLGAELGAVFAAGGIGSVVCAVIMGQAGCRGAP